MRVLGPRDGITYSTSILYSVKCSNPLMVTDVEYDVVSLTVFGCGGRDVVVMVTLTPADDPDVLVIRSR